MVGWGGWGIINFWYLRISHHIHDALKITSTPTVPAARHRQPSNHRLAGHELQAKSTHLVMSWRIRLSEVLRNPNWIWRIWDSVLTPDMISVCSILLSSLLPAQRRCNSAHVWLLSCNTCTAILRCFHRLCLRCSALRLVHILCQCASMPLQHTLSNIYIFFHAPLHLPA
jgi:hypothetical protein